MTLIWFNQGYSSIRDALVMIRQEAGGAVRTLASHEDLQAPVMHVADEVLKEPRIDRTTPAGQAAYLDYCLRTCAERRVDLFLAQTGRVLLAPHKDKFAAIGTRLSVPADADTLELVDDKALFYDAALRAGIPMPWTREITCAEDYDDAIDYLKERGLRACVKPPRGVFGNGFWRLKYERSLFDTLMNPDLHEISVDAMRGALQQSPGKRLLVLEYLAGVEWSVDCVCQDGDMVAAVARRKLGRVQQLEVSGPALDIARHAVRHFGLSGLINVQCKAAGPKGSDIRLLEINARMSGGCLYTRYSGINLPWIHVALELGLMPRDAVPVPKGGALVSPSAEAYEIVDGIAPDMTPEAAHA